MPDDYNTTGFQQDDSGIYGDTKNQGSRSDYDSWDWKQIMAAVTGGSNMTPGAGGEARASSVSNPQTLMTAANEFQAVQELMEMVGKSLADQAKALAGGKGAPWQGAAADAFADTMTTFSREVLANAAALGGGSTGTPVGPSLVQGANSLAFAQAQIHAIDTWYANEAIKVGVVPMANGLIPVSQRPDIVEMMTNDMRSVLKSLANNYSTVTQSLNNVKPKAVTPPTSDPASTGDGKNNDQDLDQYKGGGGQNGIKSPDLNTGTGGGSGGGTGGGVNSPDLSTLGGGSGGTGGTASPYTGGTASPDLATGSGGGITAPDLATLGTGDGTGTGGTANPYTGGVASPDLATGASGIGSPDLGALGTGDGTGTGGTADPYTGGTGLPELGAGSTVDPYTGTSIPGASTPGALNPGALNPGALDPGALDPALDGVLNPPTGTAGTGTPAAFPLGGLGGIPSASIGTPGSSGSGQNLSELPNAWTGGSTTPDLPGVTPAGLPETGTGAAGLPDGLSPSAMPTSGLVSAPGLSADGVGASGMPMMPMSPGVGAGAAGAGSGAERPDAAGLLGGAGVVPWASPGGLDDFAPVAGVAAGGAELGGVPAAFEGVPGAGVPLPGSEASGLSGDGVGASGMPMMPMSPGVGAGAAGAGSGAERPDAAGLLGGAGVVPWTEEGAPGTAGELPAAGAPSGGAGLTGPGVAASTAEGASTAAETGTPLMPMMPGAHTAGAGTRGNTEGERPDSAGLLGGPATSWLPHPSEHTGEAASAGAAAGGAVLNGLTEQGTTPPPAATADAVSSAGAPAPAPGAPAPSAGADGGPEEWGAAGGTPLIPGVPLSVPGTAGGPGTPSAAPGSGRGGQGRPAPAGAATAEAGDAGEESAAPAPLPDDLLAVTPLPEDLLTTAPLPDGLLAPAPLPEDRIAVVAPEGDTDDVSAWDVAAAGFSPLLLALAGRGAAADGGDDVGTSRYTVADPAVWDAEGSAVQLAEHAVAPAAPTTGHDGPELTTWRPSQRPAPAAGTVQFAGAGEPPRSGDGGDPGDQPTESDKDPDGSAEDPEEENEETGAVQLLRQDASTWGTRPQVIPDSLG
ncbi:WXG100 family type VII secretion target [Streptomyces sp. NBC_00102]|uniref:WXG100 family type VII secretion target n=1 Tax=Streptomyces sp. NBC_00102 TaxID=2975652 RepID=UPI0022572661|nr:WXG100 family type VII secretion target [Streptomyces sp. NBC_00102]MCX5401202.1 WXG100 family type VII secretion target [Streptomyces sp. NBC_00102]